LKLNRAKLRSRPSRKQTGQNGDSYNASMDLGRVNMKMEKPQAPVEKLKYAITASGNTGELQLKSEESHRLGNNPGEIAWCLEVAARWSTRRHPGFAGVSAVGPALSA
jgi:hypothetical protein